MIATGITATTATTGTATEIARTDFGMTDLAVIADSAMIPPGGGTTAVPIATKPPISATASPCTAAADWRTSVASGDQTVSSFCISVWAI